MTGTCKPDAPDDDGTDGGATRTSPKLPLGCEPTLYIRQSSKVLLPAPGVRSLDDITAQGVPGDGLVATPVRDDHGDIWVRVETKPGTEAGGKFGGDDRVIKIVSTVAGYQFVRPVNVSVSYIYAGPGGSDDNAGMLGSMFATFRQAAKAAGPGDTIILGNVSDTDKTELKLPAGITVSNSLTTADSGVDPNALVAPINLPMKIVLSGDAHFDNLIFGGGRLVIDAPGSHVVLNNVTDEFGLTISETAVPFNGKSTLVEISNNSHLRNGFTPNLPPLLVQADGATVILSGDLTSVTTEVPGTNVENIRLEGAGTTLEILSNIGLNNADRKTVLHALKATTLNVKGTRFASASIQIDDPGSEGTFDQVSFNQAPITFNGSSFKTTSNTSFSDSPLTFRGQLLSLRDTTIEMLMGGPGLIQMPPSSSGGAGSQAMLFNVTFKNAPIQFTGGDLTISGDATTFTSSPLTFNGGKLSISAGVFRDSLLTFQGTSLSAADALFDGQGIIQGGANSTSIIEHTQITNYTQFGYRLDLGQVRLLDSTFVHSPSVTTDPKTPDMPPWALLIKSPHDPEGSSVSSMGTTYDGTTPVTCIAGPDAVAGVYYSKMTSATIAFSAPAEP
jgi:hypothetical protein